MDVYEIKNSVNHIENSLKLLIDLDYLKELELEIVDIENMMMEPSYYSNHDLVLSNSTIISNNKHILESYHLITGLIEDTKSFLAMLHEEYDHEIANEVDKSATYLQQVFNSFETYLLMDEDYDQSNAIMEIHVGAGGTESQDWVEMLYKMYVSYAKKKGFKIDVLSAHYAQDVGIKNITFKIDGLYAYGLLKNEKGSHRLVRISPFDASGKRHTTVASVNVSPILDDIKEIELNDNDLQIDTFKSSGAGGQSVNTTDSAVRVTHLPTGIVVNCSNERSQTRNKAIALEVLKSKLLELKIQEKEAQLKELKGEYVNANFGSQIRSYTFNPYSLVKDHRSNYESTNPSLIMSGDLEDVINSVLREKKGMVK